MRKSNKRSKKYSSPVINYTYYHLLHITNGSVAQENKISNYRYNEFFLK